MNGFSNSSCSSKKPQKRSLAGETIDVPLEVRLENLAVDVPQTSVTPTSESLVHLLLQVSIYMDVQTINNYSNFMIRVLFYRV